MIDFQIALDPCRTVVRRLVRIPVRLRRCAPLELGGTTSVDRTDTPEAAAAPAIPGNRGRSVLGPYRQGWATEVNSSLPLPRAARSAE